MVGHEERVEPAALQRLDEALDMREIEVGIRVGAGIAPGCRMDAGRPHEGAEMELTSRCHIGPSSGPMMGDRARRCKRGFILVRMIGCHEPRSGFLVQGVEVVGTACLHPVYASWVTPSRWSALRCSLVGAAKTMSWRSAASRRRFRVSVARSTSEVRKLWTGSGSPCADRFACWRLYRWRPARVLRWRRGRSVALSGQCRRRRPADAPVSSHNRSRRQGPGE